MWIPVSMLLRHLSVTLAICPPRAVEVLQDVDLIAAEDTRHSQRLLQHYAIDTPVMAYHDHSDERALEKIIACKVAVAVSRWCRMPVRR